MSITLGMLEEALYPFIIVAGGSVGNSYRDLIAWQRAVGLSVQIYEMTANFPREEIYGLSSQMRHAAVFIASNIAEGYGAVLPANTVNS